MTVAVMQGRRLPEEVLGPLNVTFWPGVDEANRRTEFGRQLRTQLQDEGYLLIRGVHSREDVLSARAEVFQRLVDVGEILPPAVDGIATGRSLRRESVDNLGSFWRSVSHGRRLRTVSHGEAISGVMNVVYGERSVPHDYIFLRPSMVGRSTHLHYDQPFFARGSNRILTVWTALGEIPLTEGPLAVIERGHTYHDLIEAIADIDYDSSQSPQVQIMDDVVDFVRSRNTRILTIHFQPGDLVVFTMTTLHGTLDNGSPDSRCRLSCDVRWQPASDPLDPRYQGSNPPGTTGAGYGELNGAKPLTEEWHTR